MRRGVERGGRERCVRNPGLNQVEPGRWRCLHHSQQEQGAPKRRDEWASRGQGGCSDGNGLGRRHVGHVGWERGVAVAAHYLPIF